MMRQLGRFYSFKIHCGLTGLLPLVQDTSFAAAMLRTSYGPSAQGYVIRLW